MTSPPERASRPLLWGFFVAVGLMVLLLGVRYGGTWYLSTTAPEITRQREAEIRESIRKLFRSKVGQLHSVALAVASDRAITEKLTSHLPSEAAEAFEALDRKRPTEELSLDIFDPQGSLIAWSGRRVYKDFAEIHALAEGDTSSLIARSGLHSYLSAALRIPDKGIIVVASEPLELHYPISNQFVQQTSITREISQLIGQEVELLPGRNNQAPSRRESRLRIEIEDPSGTAIGAILTAMPSVENEILKFHTTTDLLLKLVGALLSVAALLVLSRLIRPFNLGLEILVWCGLLWIVRVAWHLVEFPSTIIGGALFDPSEYGSPFAFGLTSSAGETLISSVTLFCTILYMFARVSFPTASPAPELRRPGKTIGSFAAMFGVSLLLCVVARAYGAALRSFVFDSTLQYIDPARLVPDPLVVVMHVVIILLSAAFLLLTALALGFMRGWISVVFKSPLYEWVAVFAGLTLSIIVFGYFDRVPQVPFGLLFLIAAGGFLSLRFAGNSGGTGFFAKWPVLVTLAAASFVISSPVLDQKLHEKEEEELRLQVDEMLRPADSWLSFVVTDGFRTVSNSFLELSRESNESQGPTERRIAFPLWAQTLMSKEGYNSALVLYDASGNETSRFSVGLTTYEQTEILKRLFDADEEVLQVVERRIPDGVLKYYGLWGTIRGENGEVVSMAAVILSASAQNIFRGETIEPLRPVSSGKFRSRYRRVIVSEFEESILASSSRNDFWPGAKLPQSVVNDFNNGKKYVRTLETFDGTEFETLYGRDEATPGRVVAVSVEEVGLRWHLFHLVKVIATYFVTFGLAALLLLAVKWREYQTTVLGFRGKLVAAFVLVAAIPLLVFGYYNREFAAERLEQSVSKKLEKDLSLVRQRIMSTIAEEEDFFYGVTNDFCETVASELGADFTVFRRFEVHASSRPELYESSILDARMSGRAFARLVVEGRQYVQHSERIGEIDYAVGYRPLVFEGRLLGVLSVPTLYQQQDIEEELVERNAFLLGMYSILLIITIVAGIVLANQLSQPIRELTRAANAVGRGNLDVRVQTWSSGELGELVGTFNRMTEELKRNREELSRIERELAWKEMAKQVAHEIKNPLTPMKLSVQHLRQAFKDKASDLDDVVAKVTQTVMDQIDALARIASEFSNFARMPERRFEQVDLHRLLTETIQLFGNVRGIEIQSKFSDTHPILIADADELRRVFINIMRNSVQAMERGGKIRIESSVSEGACTIQISDTGGGIPRDLQSKVFQPNFSTKTDGTGLGLAIARKVVEDLNGTIRLSSTPGEGTQVEIRLPLLTGHGQE